MGRSHLALFQMAMSEYVTTVCPSVGLHEQAYKCFDCEIQISFQGLFPEPRRCDYSGQVRVSHLVSVLFELQFISQPTAPPSAVSVPAVPPRRRVCHSRARRLQLGLSAAGCLAAVQGDSLCHV